MGTHSFLTKKNGQSFACFEKIVYLCNRYPENNLFYLKRLIPIEERKATACEGSRFHVSLCLGMILSGKSFFSERHTVMLFDIFHLSQNLVFALHHIGRGRSRTIFAGIRQCGGNEGTLALGQLGARQAEMPLGYGLGTIDAIAHLDGVEVDFHDALLAPHQFDECCEIGLKPFAHPSAAWPQEHVLGRLLADGAGTQLAFVVLTVALGSLLDGLEVEAMVGEETLVFAGDDSQWHVGSHLAQRHPVVTQFDFLALRNLLTKTDEHQWREPYGKETEGHNSKNGGAEKGYHHPFHDLLESSVNIEHSVVPCVVLLACFSIGSVDHLLAGIHVDFYTAVLGLAGSGLVGSNGILLTETINTLNLGAGHAEALQIRRNGIGAAQREILVLLDALLGGGVFPAGIVGVALDGYVAAGVVVQHLGKLGQRGLGLGSECGRTGGEENTGVEGHLHSLQTVGVGHRLYLGVLHSFSLSLGLVHLLADDDTSTRTNSSANSSTNSGVAGNLTYDSTEQSTTASTDSGTFLSVVTA